MFDIGWSELLVIAVVAIVVVGPRELPGMLRTFGKYAGQLRRMAGDFQHQFNEALKEAELDDVRKSIESVRSINPMNQVRDAINPLKNAGDDLRRSIEAPATSRNAEASEAGSNALIEPAVPDPSAPPPAKAAHDPAKLAAASAARGRTKAAAPKKPAAAKSTAEAKKPAAKKPAARKAATPRKGAAKTAAPAAPASPARSNGSDPTA